jgi:hypothetical protein
MYRMIRNLAILTPIPSVYIIMGYPNIDPVTLT